MDQPNEDVDQLGAKTVFTVRRKRAGESLEDYWEAVLEFGEKCLKREFPGCSLQTLPAKRRRLDEVVPNQGDVPMQGVVPMQATQPVVPEDSIAGRLQSMEISEINENASTSSHFGRESKTGTQLKGFKKTIGAANGDGLRYEYKMLTLVSLRMRRTDLEFELATNMEDAGKFDDIVVKYRKKNTNEPWTVTCVQLKHKDDTNKIISKKEFLELSGNFSLIQYGFSSLNAKQKDSISNDSHDTRFIIFTNANIDDSLVDVSDSDQIFATGGQAVSFKVDGEVYRGLFEWVDFKETISDLLGQGKGLSSKEVGITIKDTLQSVGYQNEAVMSLRESVLKDPTLNKLKNLLEKLKFVSSKEVYVSFLAELRVYKKQAPESKLDAKIKEEFAKVFVCGDDVELSEMAKNFKEKIQTWWRDDNYFLTQDSELWLKLQAENLSKSTVNALTKTVIEFEDSCLRVVYSEIERKNWGILNLRVDSRTAASSLKVRQALSRFGAGDMNFLHVNVKALLAREDDVFLTWANTWCQVLVVECDDQLDRKKAAQICEKFSKMFERENAKLLVLIAPASHALSVQLSRDVRNSQFLDNASWNDLTANTKETILAMQVFLNGVASGKTLGELVGRAEGFFNQVGLDAISQFLTGHIHCGMELDKESEFFVTRRLQKSAKGDPFAVNSVNDVTDRVVLLVAPPGMGKSTLFAHLAMSAKKEDPLSLVVHIKLNDCAKYLKKMGVANITMNEADDFLEQATLSHGNDVDKLLFRFLKRNQVVFIDGVDEACPNYEKQVFLLLSILKGIKVSQLWVASRPVLKEKLESSLKVESHRLPPFSSVDQTEFFNKFWVANVPSADPEERRVATEKLLAMLTDSLGEENTILGVPLMNAMVAEKFQNKIFSTDDVRGTFEMNTRLDVMDLYKTFFQRKFDLYCDEKKKMQHRDVSSNLIDNDNLLNRLTYTHRLAALRVLLSPKEFSGLRFEGQQNFRKDLNVFLKEVSESKEKIGIIDNVARKQNIFVPIFTHRSFSEYFAASWLADNFEANRDLIERITFAPSYQGVSEMFSRSLAEGHRLHVAIANRDLEETKRILSTQSELVDVNALDKGGRTVLHLAILCSATDRDTNWIDIIKSLVLEHKASLNIADKVLGWIPLQYATWSGAWEALHFILTKPSVDTDLFNVQEPSDSVPDLGNPQNIETKEQYKQLMLDAAKSASVEVIRFLVEKCHGPLDCKGREGETMVHAAAQGGKVDNLKYITSKGLALDAEDKLGNTVLHYAAPETVSYLVENGLDLDKVNSRNLTAFQEAAQGEDDKKMATLLANNVSYKVGKEGKNRDARFRSSLLCAAFAGNLEYVQKLIKMRVEIYPRNNKKNTAVKVAYNRGHYEVMNWLLEKECKGEVTPLGVACRNGDSEIVEFMLRRGDDVEGKGSNETTPLGIASETGNVDIVKLLLEKEASLESPDKEGRTPLHKAVRYGECDVVKLLLENGASVKSCDKEGRTPLHKAVVRFGGYDVVKLLLENGASVESCDKEGKTPLHKAAVQIGGYDVVKLLLENGASLESCDKEGRTPLHKAAEGFGGCDVVKLLLENGASLESCDKEGRTPLYEAARLGRYDVVKLLLENGASLESPDKEGRTPLHNAALFINPEFYFNENITGVISLLLERGADVNALDFNWETPLDVAVLEKTKKFLRAKGALLAFEIPP